VRRLGLVAAGTGIAPVLQLLRAVLESWGVDVAAADGADVAANVGVGAGAGADADAAQFTDAAGTGTLFTGIRTLSLDEPTGAGEGAADTAVGGAGGGAEAAEPDLSVSLVLCAPSAEQLLLRRQVETLLLAAARAGPARIGVRLHYALSQEAAAAGVIGDVIGDVIGGAAAAAVPVHVSAGHVDREVLRAAMPKAGPDTFVAVSGPDGQASARKYAAPGATFLRCVWEKEGWVQCGWAEAAGRE
jgi:hypothetical protein